MLNNLLNLASVLIVYLNVLDWSSSHVGILKIIIKNHKEEISIEFPESVNLEISYFDLELALLYIV